jgi:hypothetical protein
LALSLNFITLEIKMKKTALSLLTLLVLSNVHAEPSQDKITQCLADSTTGKDRKELARWMLAAMAQHPAMTDMASVPQEKVDALNKSVAGIFTRLLTVDCTTEVKEVAKSQGEAAARSSFEFLGRLAMQELAANQKVSEAMAGFSKYADNAKLRQVLSPN